MRALIKCVIDTNIFVSALLRRDSPPRRILDAWYQKEFDLIVSPDLLDEVGSVLLRPRLLNRGAYSAADVTQLLDDLREGGVFCIPLRHHQTLVVDRDDNFLFDAAVETRADYIVSGDKLVLKLRDYKGVTEIVSPREFYAILATRRVRKGGSRAA